MQNKKVLIGIGATVLLLSSYFIGSTTAVTTLKEKTVSYNQIESEIKKQNEELTSTKEKLAAANKELASVQTQYKEAKDLIAKREELVKNVQLSQDVQMTMKKEIDQMNEQLNTKKIELERLSNAIVTKKQTPKQLPAGHFTVGKDIEAGRYQVTAVGRGSNFVVRDSIGDLKVNTIIGGGFGVAEYVVELADGDSIEQEMRVKFTSIE